MPTIQTLDEFIAKVQADLPKAPDCFYAIPDAEPYDARNAVRDYVTGVCAQKAGFADAADREEAIDALALTMQGQVRAVNERYSDSDRDAVNRYAEQVIDTAETALSRHFAELEKSGRWASGLGERGAFASR